MQSRLPHAIPQVGGIGEVGPYEPDPKKAPIRPVPTQKRKKVCEGRERRGLEGQVLNPFMVNGRLSDFDIAKNPLICGGKCGKSGAGVRNFPNDFGKKGDRLPGEA